MLSNGIKTDPSPLSCHQHLVNFCFCSSPSQLSEVLSNMSTDKNC